MSEVVFTQSGGFNAPSADDWNKYRQTITNLYVGQRMSLPRLMEHMRSVHGFHATTKMYKMRFTLWKLRKNMTAERALGAVDENYACGTGFKHALTEVQKRKEYLRRLSKERRAQLLGRALQPVVTPSCNPIVPPSPASLTPPTGLLIPEYYLHLLSSYVRGSFEAQRWAVDEKDGLRNEDVVPAWCSSVMSAVSSLKAGKEAEARRFLRCFIKQAPHQLSRQDPLLFSFIYTSILAFAKDRPDIAQSLLQDIWHLSETLPWTNSAHPLRLLIWFMARLGTQNIIFYAAEVLLAYINIIHKTLGAAYPIVQDMLSDTTWRLVHHQLMGAEGVAESGSRMLLAAELQGQDRCQHNLNLKMHLAGAYLQIGNHRQARSVTTDIMAVRNKDIRSDRMMPSLNMLISRIDEAGDRHEDAIESALKAVVVSIETFGEWSDWTVNTLDFYCHVLEKAGRTKAAQEVMKDRDSAIMELCRKSESLTISDSMSSR